jgi:uncharacterized membrane protein
MVELIAVGALVLAIHTWSRLRELHEQGRRQQSMLERLIERIERMEDGRRPAPTAEARPMAAAAPHADTAPSPSPAPPPRVAPGSGTAPPPSGPPPRPTPTPADVSPAAPAKPPPPPRVPPPPVVPPPPRATTPPPSEPPRDRVPPPPPRPPQPPRPKAPAIDWEGLVGVKLFSWIAGIALVFAAVFFLRYSVDRGWLGPPIRMAIGLIVGVGLLAGCELRVARRYPTTANALDAAGIATLFATLFAAHALWNLLPQVPTFLAMALVTAVAVALSIRRDSVFISLLGLVGGFATPALLSTGENRPIPLFGYLLVLNVGLAWVAYQRGWVVLTAASVVLTTLYQWAWVARFLHESPLPLAMAIFLVFPAVQMGALLLAGGERTKTTPLFSRVAVGAAIVPLLFGLYLAAVPVYGAHMSLLFGFVLVVGAGLALVAAVRGPAELHLVGALGTVLAFAVWCGTSYGHAHWPGILAWVAAAVVATFVEPWAVTLVGRDLGTAGRQSRLAAAALLAVPAFLAGAEPAAASPWLLFGTLAVLVAFIATVSVASDDGGPHFLGIVFVIAAEAIWSSKHLAPSRLYAAMILYAGFGLFYAAVPIVAAWMRRRLASGPGSAVALVASLGLVFFLASGAMAHTALLAIGALLGVLTAALFVPAVTGPFPILRLLGIVVAWCVLLVWWATAMVATLVLPALLVVAGMGLLVVMGHAWLGARSERPDAGLALGLGAAVVVHLFLARLVVDPELAFPPWPWLAVLLVVDLAIATGALAIRDGRPHLAAIFASQIVVMLWGADATGAPWPVVAIEAADATALLSLVWIGLARRRRCDSTVFAQAAVAGVTLAMVIAIFAAEADGSPSVAWLVADQAIMLMALLAIAEVMAWDQLRLFAVVPAALATAVWVDGHVPDEPWQAGLAFAVMPFLVFVADAFRRASQPGALRSLQAALASGIVSLALARHCLLAGGHDGVIGLVPVAQALLMMLVLRRVLAHRAPGPAGGDGRVALAAAGALGFATAAVPLQLSLEHITVAWALEAAALAWLYRRIRFPQLVWWVGGIAAAVFARLALNPAVLEYHPRATTPIFNWYLYLYGVSALALFATAAFLRGSDDRVLGARLTQILPGAATVLLFLLVNIEVADYYSTGSTLTFDFLSASLAQDLTYTLAWATFAIALLAAGIRVASRFVRGAALALLMATIVKCFLHDLWRLGGLYRVGSFVGLAFFLSLVAVLLQRFVFLPKEDAAAVREEPA